MRKRLVLLLLLLAAPVFAQEPVVVRTSVKPDTGAVVGLTRDGAHQRIARLEWAFGCRIPLFLERRVGRGDQRRAGIDSRRHRDLDRHGLTLGRAGRVAGAVEQRHLGRRHGEHAATPGVERELEALAGVGDTVDAVSQRCGLGLEAQDLRARDLGHHDARRPWHIAGEHHVDVQRDPLADHGAAVGLHAGAHDDGLLGQRRSRKQGQEQEEPASHGFCSSWNRKRDFRNSAGRGSMRFSQRARTVWSVMPPCSGGVSMPPFLVLS